MTRHTCSYTFRNVCDVPRYVGETDPAAMSYLTVLNESRGNRQPHYNPTTSSNVNQPGATRLLDVEVRGPIVHSVPVHKVATWLARGLNSPKEAILKERLRSLV